MPTTAEPTLADVRSRLDEIDQAHLLTFYDELDEASQRSLLAQIDSLELERVPEWIDAYVRSKPAHEVDPDRLEPAPYYPADHASGAHAWDRAHYRSLGEDMLREGKVAAFTVAGGQGSRLGFDGPKGAFPATPVSRKPIFRCLAEWCLAAAARYGRAPLWAIMTSPLNHDATVAFFDRHGHFGLDRDDVLFFNQGVMPSFDMASGRILLARKGAVATNPDGHGGSLRALHHSGALETMRSRGVEHVSYFHVDNPIVRVVDPTFVGLHAHAPDSSAQMSSKMVPKASWDEKVGVFARIDDKTSVLEYSDLPERLARLTDDAGVIRFNAGSVGIHTIGVAFVESLNAGGGFSLPFHRAEKKVAHVDPATGEAVRPESPNAIKLETFVFDAIPLADRSIVYETDRTDEFAPIKNARGTDSPETSMRIQTERAARMLRAAGVAVPRTADGAPDCTLELAPTFATAANEIDASRVPPIEPGSSHTLD